MNAKFCIGCYLVHKDGVCGSCSSGGKAAGIRHAIQWIRENHGKTIDVKRIAAKAAMGVTTFHRRFKQITGLSPVQFQKQLRLLQARKLLAFSGHRLRRCLYGWL